MSASGSCRTSGLNIVLGAADPPALEQRKAEDVTRLKLGSFVTLFSNTKRLASARWDNSEPPSSRVYLLAPKTQRS